jgi:phytoene synthase
VNDRDALRASYRYCGAVARREARNFYPSFLLLPADRRRSMCALYAFLRHTDDLVDGAGSAPEKAGALAAWRSDLEAALARRHAAWPGLPALADTVARHAIPPRHLHAVLDGVAMDVQPRPFATFDDLYVYCYRVASAVGLSCLHIWGYRSEGGKAEALAEACGIALQLTNILRDVREDARGGRVYLPVQDLERFGVAAPELIAGRPSDRVRALLAFEGRRAYAYYSQAGPLVHLVAPVGRPVLRAIVGIYRALLDEIARRDYDVLAARVTVPAWQKTTIALRALAGRFGRSNVEGGVEPSPAELPPC